MILPGGLYSGFLGTLLIQRSYHRFRKSRQSKNDTNFTTGVQVFPGFEKVQIYNDFEQVEICGQKIRKFELLVKKIFF